MNNNRKKRKFWGNKLNIAYETGNIPLLKKANYELSKIDNFELSLLQPNFVTIKWNKVWLIIFFTMLFLIIISTTFGTMRR